MRFLLNYSSLTEPDWLQTPVPEGGYADLTPFVSGSPLPAILFFVLVALLFVYIRKNAPEEYTDESIASVITRSKPESETKEVGCSENDHIW